MEMTPGITVLVKKIKILISDDHKLVRQALRKMLEQQEDMQIVAEATNGCEAVKLAEQVSPDVILMDVNMPELDGIEATKLITNSNKNHVHIIGLSLHQDDTVKRSMLKAGAVAYLTKSDDPKRLCEAIRAHI